MSVATAIAAIAHPTGRRRAVDEVARLRAQSLSLVVLVWHLMRRLVEATAARDAANAKISQLGEVEAQLAETTQHATRLEAEVTALRAQLANTNAVSDRPAYAAVTETQEIQIIASAGKVWPLSEAAARGLL
ncbi:MULTISPECIES: hypothetical protein [unclassified Streptomyces]|uniref:hypothetical protein n=1 Tax=unclassified Streptomyces TaxID=2593676 RepID=UPI00332185D6